jgi:hypothetical protein
MMNSTPGDIFARHGYTYTGSCNCGGIYTEKWRKGEFIIRWRKKRYTFKVMQAHEGTILTWQPIKLLENTLNELAKKNMEA